MQINPAVGSVTVPSAPRRKVLHNTLWVVQILLALGFGIAGVTKLGQPIEVLAKMMGWPGDVPPALVRFIGLSELAGAIGIVVPAAVHIRPRLTAWAATGLFGIMLLAALFHLSRGEAQFVPVNIVLGGLAAFVAWGRFWKVPIAPRA